MRLKITVSTITTRPSLIERPKALQMSITPTPSNSDSNQKVEKPRIGKVSPPSGPWKDSTRIEIIGP